MRGGDENADFPESCRWVRFPEICFPDKAEGRADSGRYRRAGQPYRTSDSFWQDRFVQTSDLDLAVDAPGVCEDDFAKIARGFWKAIPSEVDIVDYNGKKSELLKDEIDNKGVVIYSANKQ